ncbi:MAG: hypothetical protein JWL74_1237 [Alphaproteobacteria bacterium]|jgi:hypothetical protein|nr:hypothetical protein [Alphaproteobacteria bacterium]
MASTAPDRARRRHRRLPLSFAFLSALGASQAALWFYFRKRQPLTDRRTRDRLQPKARTS